jgi:hypothetical protein
MENILITTIKSLTNNDECIYYPGSIKLNIITNTKLKHNNKYIFDKIPITKNITEDHYRDFVCITINDIEQYYKQQLFSIKSTNNIIIKKTSIKINKNKIPMLSSFQFTLKKTIDVYEYNNYEICINKNNDDIYIIFKYGVELQNIKDAIRQLNRCI